MSPFCLDFFLFSFQKVHSDEQTKFTEVLYMFTVSNMVVSQGISDFPLVPARCVCSVMSVGAMSRCTISIPFHYYGRAPKWAPQMMCVPNRCTCVCVCFFF